MPKTNVYLVYQWWRGCHAGGDDDQRCIIGVAFAPNDARAIEAIPAGRVHEPSSGINAWSPVAIEYLGEITIGETLPFFLESLA